MFDVPNLTHSLLRIPEETVTQVFHVDIPSNDNKGVTIEFVDGKFKSCSYRFDTPYTYKTWMIMGRIARMIERIQKGLNRGNLRLEDLKDVSDPLPQESGPIPTREEYFASVAFKEPPMEMSSEVEPEYIADEASEDPIYKEEPRKKIMKKPSKYKSRPISSIPDTID